MADDFVSATVEPNLHSATSPKKVFVPSQISPSNPRVVNFTSTRVWHQDDLDTEIGDEELFAYARLRDVTANSKGLWVPSSVQSLSP